MRILYLGLGRLDETYRRILTGDLPTDRLYGVVELQRLGYDVSLKCMRPQGPLRSLFNYINTKFGLNLPGFKTLVDLRKFDVIVVNGPWSTLITMTCKMLGKKIVYLDTILKLPQNIFRKLIYTLNLKLSDGTVMYSVTQKNLCIKVFNVHTACFKLLPFSIDYNYYQRFHNNDNTNKPFVLAVGRDQARDYATLVKAMTGLDVNLKLVTLPYLLQELNLKSDWIEILENVSYEELYRLYAEALFVVIPLKKWGTLYSSGTRALLEAKALGKTVIATHSAPLEEYMGREEGVFYVEPENVSELRQCIVRLLENREECMKYEMKSREIVKYKYSMDVFAGAFGSYLSGLFRN